MLNTSLAQQTPKNKWVPAIQTQGIVNVSEVLSSFNRGQRRYVAGDPPQACINAQERAGYMAVLNCIADAETDAYLATVPAWQREAGPEADREWIARGC